MKPSANLKPCQLEVIDSSSYYFAYDANKIDQPSVDIFNSEYWQSQQAIVGTAQGRGTTYFIDYQQQAWVLKHYYRGGLIGKLIKDKYIYLGIEKTRAKREFDLLVTMQALQLPCPAPIAIGIKKHALTYQADLITERIQHSQDVVGILEKQTLSAEQWQLIGKTIQDFHQHGIYHDDLNCHNILLDNQNQVWLIDFDRGEQKPIDKGWQRDNLDRLLRSFRKEKTRLSEFYWQESDWQSLLSGYHSAT